MSFARATIHSSQFPDAVRRDLLQSLRSRQVNHKFHYDSVKQTQKWLAVHEAFSPVRTDADCAAIYDASFGAVAPLLPLPAVHLIGLGCGGGQKDARLLSRLRHAGKRLAYTPADVSVAMTLVARAAALAVIADAECEALVCDLATAGDLPVYFDQQVAADSARLITFFGMIPNFEPQLILPRLAALVRPEDHLLFSANLAPGPDYLAGVQKILPLYDNVPTREWLLAFLFDLGIEPADGQLQFQIETDADSGLKRVTAHFHFEHARSIRVEQEAFQFAAGDSIRLFFSYRHTPDRIRELLSRHGLNVRHQWIASSGEEGVFLCARAL